MGMQSKTIEIHLGNKCNNNCLTCLQKNNKNLKIQDKIPLSLVAEKIFFTGGESLLYFNDILDCYSLIPEETKSIAIFTNGRLIPQIYKTLPKDSRLKFIISLYSLNSDIHDYITDVKGSFFETIAGIEICKSNNINYELSIPVFKINIDGIKEEFDAFPDVYKNITLGRNICINEQPSGKQILEFLNILDSKKYSEKVKIKYFPLCLFPDGYRNSYIMNKDNKGSKKISTYGNRIVEYKKSNYTYEVPLCENCSQRDVCDHILKDYENNYSFLREIRTI